MYGKSFLRNQFFLKHFFELITLGFVKRKCWTFSIGFSQSGQKCILNVQKNNLKKVNFLRKKTKQSLCFGTLNENYRCSRNILGSVEKTVFYAPRESFWLETIFAKTKIFSTYFGFLSALFVLFCKKYPAKSKKLHFKCTEEQFVENKLSWKNLLLWLF